MYQWTHRAVHGWYKFAVLHRLWAEVASRGQPDDSPQERSYPLFWQVAWDEIGGYRDAMGLEARSSLTFALSCHQFWMLESPLRCLVHYPCRGHEATERYTCEEFSALTLLTAFRRLKAGCALASLLSGMRCSPYQRSRCRSTSPPRCAGSAARRPGGGATASSPPLTAARTASC